jgi:hypothetical protein
MPTVPVRVGSRAPVNAGLPWDDFDPDLYHESNYLVLREDDRRILQVTRDFLATQLRLKEGFRAIDVGSGANIYPALAMLPFCNRLTLWERGLRNVHWLKRQVSRFSNSWFPYWHVLNTRARYRTVDDPRLTMRDRCTVAHADLFDLPSREWDVGTMFFVAESISGAPREFRLAMRCFIAALKPRAPFVAAFMRDSEGYDVGSLRFPAVKVSEDDVSNCLSPLAHDVRILRIRSVHRRNGYDGMILALGKAGAPD